MAKVFVSHRDGDATLAKRLADEVEAAGHEVWLDAWEVEPGDSIVQRMNTGLEGAAYVVLCYSTDGVESPWISREWMSALARQLNGYKVKLVPVRLSGGRPPAILADVRYADLAKDWSRGMAELLKALR